MILVCVISFILGANIGVIFMAVFGCKTNKDEKTMFYPLNNN